MRFCCSGFGSKGKELLAGNIQTFDDAVASSQRDHNQHNGERSDHVDSLAFHNDLSKLTCPYPTHMTCPTHKNMALGAQRTASSRHVQWNDALRNLRPREFTALLWVSPGVPE